MCLFDFPLLIIIYTITINKQKQLKLYHNYQQIQTLNNSYQFILFIQLSQYYVIQQQINHMVLLNYENFIKEKIMQQTSYIQDVLVINALKLDSFHKFLIKLYQYCEEINIIQQRMKILAEQTQKIKGMKPKLLESQTLKVGEKIKQIGSIYSLFLMQQKRFKVLSDQSSFYEKIYQIVINIMQKCFTKTNFQHLQKQIHRLIRTNTFNRKICWKQYVDERKKNPQTSEKNKKRLDYSFSNFRRNILNEKSQIKPYVNNKSCFRSKYTRSPIIALLYPNNEFLQFDLRKKQKKMNQQK